MPNIPGIVGAAIADIAISIRGALRALPFKYKIRRFTPARALPGCVQIALKPASKGLGLHRVFIRGKGRMYVVADGAFKGMKVDARAC